MRPPWSVAVVVPAHNEAELVSACLSSIRASLAHARRQHGLAESALVLVADCCTDDTAARAECALGRDGFVIEVGVRSAGRSRRIGVDAALESLGALTSARTWVMATDADTVVPTDWVATHLALAGSGAAAVAGVVTVRDFPGHTGDHGRGHDTFRAVFSAHYDRLIQPHSDADHQHGHVHGANLGVRADAYQRVGGWPPLALGEDHALWDRLGLLGVRRVATRDSWVLTSGRRDARAARGFAATLSSWVEGSTALTGGARADGVVAS